MAQLLLHLTDRSGESIVMSVRSVRGGRSLVAGKSGWWRSTAFVVVCGCLIALITYGLRTSFGLFATPISGGRGWSPEVFALAIAIQNIV